ncbi:hypothetical protein TrVE_jg3523 [Triparma verrucosa]|uniref:Bromodomain-containing protein n=1 Tax=Triparma verrucosa TaxID=1606542 RepID=A0A9W7B4E6_9STRA|nr:hypothetical protein TrVE_jg3523 [Triparma verrucosa]
MSTDAEELRAVTRIVESLIARTDSGPFREPVDWKGMGLWDYPDVISELMDLGTVLKKIRQGKYENVNDVRDDVRTVFNNCMTYNTEGSDFYTLGESYLLRFDSMFGKLAMYGGEREKRKVEMGQGRPGLEQKKTFAENLFKVNGDDLGHVVQILDQKDPKSLSPVAANSGDNEPNVEINIDMIRSDVFWDLDAYLKKCRARETGNKRKR